MNAATRPRASPDVRRSPMAGKTVLVSGGIGQGRTTIEDATVIPQKRDRPDPSGSEEDHDEGDRAGPIWVGRRPRAPGDRQTDRGRRGAGSGSCGVGPRRRLARHEGVPYVLRVMGSGLRAPKDRVPGTDLAGSSSRSAGTYAVPAGRRGLRSEPPRQPLAQRRRLRRVRGRAGGDARAEAGRAHVRTGRGRSHLGIARGAARAR